MNLRGKFTTDAGGTLPFRSVMMIGYPIPTDGVVGRLLKAQSRHPYRPAHLHALIVKPGFKVLISQVYDPADPHIDSDVQFGVTQALIGISCAMTTPHPTARDVATPWYSLDHTYRLEAGRSRAAASADQIGLGRRIWACQGRRRDGAAGSLYPLPWISYIL